MSTKDDVEKLIAALPWVFGSAMSTKKTRVDRPAVKKVDTIITVDELKLMSLVEMNKRFGR